MRLENHDIQVLLFPLLGFVSQKSGIVLSSFDYQLSKNHILVKAKGSYGGLAISMDIDFVCFEKAGALGLQIEKSYMDGVIFKGDIVPYLKTLLKNQPYCCLEGRTIYFYHPKMLIKHIEVDEDGIDLVFK